MYIQDVGTPSDRALRIGHAIDVIRWMRQMEGKELAAKAGVSEASISRWQSGRVEMKLAHVGPVADALDVPVSLLLDPPSDDDDLRTAVVAYDRARRAAREDAPEP